MQTEALPIDYDFPKCVSGRPARAAAPNLSRCVTHPWMTHVPVEWEAENRGIDVSQHAESIGETPSIWGGVYIPQPEITPVSRCVTHLSRSSEVTPLGALFKPQSCLCVCVDGRPAVSHLSRCWVAWRTWETFGLQAALLSHRNAGVLLVFVNREGN